MRWRPPPSLHFDDVTPIFWPYSAMRCDGTFRYCFAVYLLLRFLKTGHLLAVGWLVGWSLTSLFSTNTAMSETSLVAKWSVRARVQWHAVWLAVYFGSVMVTVVATVDTRSVMMSSALCAVGARASGQHVDGRWRAGGGVQPATAECRPAFPASQVQLRRPRRRQSSRLQITSTVSSTVILASWRILCTGWRMKTISILCPRK